MNRREALLGLLGLAACSGPRQEPARVPEPPGAPLHLEPISDLAAAAGLVWMFDLRPRELWQGPLVPALSVTFTQKRLDRLLMVTGVDLRNTRELVVAGYREATLWLARAQVEPTTVERAFTLLDGRALDIAQGPDGRRLVPITRTWGDARGGREQLAIFGRDAVGLEHGRFGPLKAAEAFAQMRLKKALPALRATPLKQAHELLGDAPVRAFAPGPFAGEWEHGLGGLLKASTAIAASARPIDTRLAIKAIVLGAFADPAAAAERLKAVYDALAKDGLGKLCGLDKPIEPARASGTDDALTLEVTLDAMTVARGLHSATEGTVEDIVAH